jgi:membrane associated rhomboid family serine protease
MARIPARSRRQALDWSLVLLSQGIESTIARPLEGEGWALLVSEEDQSRALETLRLYKLENRRWPWRREIAEPGWFFDWASLVWVILVVAFDWLDTYRVDLRSTGIMDTRAISAGQWWRLFTALWLHADIAHLAGNAVFGFLLLGLVMGRYGTGIGLLAAYLAGAGGNLLVWLLFPGPRHSLGASGMVMAALGLLAARSLSLWRQGPYGKRYVATGVLGGVMLFVLLGLSPETDVLAHAGGFASGLLLGGLLTLLPSRRQSAMLNLVSGLIFAFLVLYPWYLALRS